MKNYCVQILSIFIFFTSFFSCSSDSKAIPDVSHIDAPLEIRRFEQTFFQMDTLAFEQALEQLAQNYPEFSQLFTANILEAGVIGQMNEEQTAYLRGFASSPVYRAVYDTTQMVYPSTDAIQEELQQALRFYRHYFPNHQAPTELITFNAAFNYAAIIYGDNKLAVGLDMFLGPDFDYPRYNPGAAIFSQYLVRTYTKEHLVASLVKVIINDIVGQQRGNRLLDMLVQEGKKLYILDQLMPTAADTVKFNVKASQWTWLQENESNLWAYLLTEDLLYNSNFQEIRKLVDPSPSGAPLLPEESPGQAANYIGYKMVKAYMKRHPNVSMEDLLLEQDAQKIMERSKYKPAR